jgi:hypothetical protein
MLRAPLVALSAALALALAAAPPALAVEAEEPAPTAETPFQRPVADADAGEGSGPYEWSATDRQVSLETCRTITPRGRTCECVLAALQGRYPSLAAALRSSDKRKLKDAELDFTRCLARSRK